MGSEGTATTAHSSHNLTGWMPQMAMHAATTFQEGNVEGAMVTFQQASGILYEIARYTPIQTGAGKDDPTKAIDLRGMEFFTPLTGGAVPGGPKYWEEAFFRYPLMPCEAANYQSHLPDTASQIAAWVVSTMFNTAVCHHIAGTTSRIEQAIQLYKDTWFTACQFDVDLSENLLMIHMAVFLNLSDCYARIGQLEESHHWLRCLQVLTLDCEKRPLIRNNPTFAFFRIAGDIRTRLSASAAA